jgi:NAD(P)-dependent dehydrogenase (short-subunit alcohol dehydrogenase family)
MLDPKNRIAMISGGSRGIGKAITDKLVNAGYRVSVGVRTPDSFEGHDRLAYFAYDAMSETAPADWLAATLDRFGPPQALINNAGISTGWSFASEDESALDDMYAVNARAPARLTRHVLPHLRACGDGRVVNIVSVAGKAVRSPTAVGYAMSKHAAIALTAGIRRAAFAEGVRATAVCPGFTATDMTSSMPSKDGMSEPEDIAEAVMLALLMSNSAAIPEIIVDGKDQW